MKSTFHLKYITLLLTVLLCSDVSISSAQNLTEDTLHTCLEYSCMDIPEHISFCGEDIDLSRFDRRERMDRELLAFTYMHSTSIQIIKRANRYFPVIESILAENGVPDDFKYLMAIESNINPLAKSGAGAAGLWQFMPVTGREFGLVVTHHVDERYHVEKSTRAACNYLKQAYAKYKSWTSVAASYNAGQGRISKELERQYADNALDLQLVEETTRYVYRILAVKLMMTHPQMFGFNLKATDLYPPIPYREIKVEKSIEDLPRFAKGQGITYALLRSMNPWIRSQSLPIHGNTHYIIRIPDKEGMHYNPKVIIPHNPNWVIK